MQDDGASFWADIKEYEGRLAHDPDSLLFARLADLYLKLGLVDDALHTARQGVARYPGFVAGQRALAMACHAKGLGEECRQALERVTTALPEDGEAQKMLARLLSAAGSRDAAIMALRTALDFNPGDTECRFELEGLERGSAATTAAAQGAAPDADAAGPAVDLLDNGFVAYGEEHEAEEIIEDIEILDMDESDLLEEEEPEDLGAAPVATDHDPLSTATLAELYVRQGFGDKALEIYHAILAADPGNAGVRSRMAELEAGRTPDFTAVPGLQPGAEPPFAGATGESSPPAAAFSATAGAAEAIAVLEGWLDNIGRLKACR
ncbi:MAG: tetratricopeptide repeat protein [Deltaproteobacteria bacterium]|nr:tetratricopeptide repeat protein [Deltaproteobacteria bacterium]